MTTPFFVLELMTEERFCVRRSYNLFFPFFLIKGHFPYSYKSLFGIFLDHDLCAISYDNGNIRLYSTYNDTLKLVKGRYYK